MIDRLWGTVRGAARWLEGVAFSRMHLRAKLTVLFLLVSVPPLVGMAAISLHQASGALDEASSMAAEALEQNAFSRLVSVREVKRGAVEEYFQTLAEQVVTFANEARITSATSAFNDGYEKIVGESEYEEEEIAGFREEIRAFYTDVYAPAYRDRTGQDAPSADAFADGLTDEGAILQHLYIVANEYDLDEKFEMDEADLWAWYTDVHSSVHIEITEYMKRFGLQDILLVDLDTMSVVYSVKKGPEFGTSLEDGPYADSPLAKIAEQVMLDPDENEAKLQDFVVYEPGWNEPSAFVAGAVWEQGTHPIGAAIFRVDASGLNALMSQREGLGETGETYLVGADLSMRSPQTSPVDTESVKSALAGESAARVATNYRGEKVLSAFTPVEIEGLEWVLVAEMGVDEAFAAVNAIDDRARASRDRLLSWVYGVAAGAFGLVLVIALGVAHGFTRPLKNAVRAIQALAAGDLTRHLEVRTRDEFGELAAAFNEAIDGLHLAVHSDRVDWQEVGAQRERLRESAERERAQAEALRSKVNDVLGVISAAADGDLRSHGLEAGDDEIGRVSGGLTGFLEQLRGNIEEIAGSAQRLKESASGLTEVSSTMTGTAHQTSEQAGMASEAADRVNENIQTAAGSIQAVERGMSEIAGTARDASNATNLAVDSAQRANETIRQLEISSSKIEEAVALITRIAGQTNLLALNATIEAARAGEAGKGFGVVASEVKELARGTANATEDISRMIEEIQRDSTAVVTVIAEIGDVIQQVNGFQEAIAANVQSQSEATATITRNVDEAAQGSEAIHASIHHLLEVARSNSSTTEQTSAAAGDLQAIAEQLQHLVDRYHC